MEQLLTPEQVADMLGMSKATLAQLRYTGTGPTFMRLSPRKIRYTASDIERWAKSMSRQSTAVA